MASYKTIAILAIIGLLPSTAYAKQARDFCADRPGLGTPACTVAPGRAMVEVGIGDWTLDRQSGSRIDTIAVAQLVTRFGLGDHLEAQIGWNGYSHVRTRDTIGTIVTAMGVGDVRIALRRNLLNPDGSGTSLAIMPYASIPVRRSAISAGDWSAGVTAPISFSLSRSIGIAFTPDIDAAVNQSGNGRHLAFGSVAGVSCSFAKSVTLTSELSWFRDNDPAGRSSKVLSGLSLAWQPSKTLQFDVGTNIGIAGSAPNQEVYFGIARRF